MGRKSLKLALEAAILEILEDSEIPLNCNRIREEVSKILKREIHFKTVKKYTEDLVKKNMVFERVLPPTKPESGIGTVLYSKYRFPDSWGYYGNKREAGRA